VTAGKYCGRWAAAGEALFKERTLITTKRCFLLAFNTFNKDYNFVAR